MMKRLMILGGSRYALPIIRAAHDLGIYVITADYLPDNFAHKFSDEYCNVSIIDREAVFERAKDLTIDGITSFACDPGVVTAAYVAERMSLPSCGPYKSVIILQNKGLFRKYLSDNGFDVPTAKRYRYAEQALHDTDIFRWPVIVKPTDSAGSKGVLRVDCPADLKNAAENALLFSQEGAFVVEDFIQQEGFSSDSDCFSVEGDLRFVSFNSQYFDISAKNPYTPAAFSWPSSMKQSQQEKLTCDLQRLLKLLDMKTAIYNIETRVSRDGIPYIMECSPRGGGNRLAECLEYATGANLIENTVRAAVDMTLLPVIQKPIQGYWAEIILHSRVDGLFERLVVDDSIHQNIVDIDLWVESGTPVKCFASANHSIGTVIIRFDLKEKMEHVMNHIDDYFNICIK